MASEPLSFPIVGIGASAGGLEAFRDVLHALPDDTGMAYVFVQHLDPTHESLLPELLAREPRRCMSMRPRKAWIFVPTMSTSLPPIRT